MQWVRVIIEESRCDAPTSSFGGLAVKDPIEVEEDYLHTVNPVSIDEPSRFMKISFGTTGSLDNLKPLLVK